MTSIFNRVHNISINNNEGNEEQSKIKLAFVRSLSIKAYPCGRRKSGELAENAAESNSYKYRIPFDPEARLNTETNLRKHISLNGFSNTHIQEYTNEKLVLALDGYTFELKHELEQESTFLAFFVNSLNEYLDINNDTNANAIYANIRLEEVPLYEGYYAENNLSYGTWILRNQSEDSLSGYANLNLDLLADEGSNIYEPGNYYFSGLSFTTTPLTGEVSNRSESYEQVKNNSTTVNQKVVSLRIFNLSNDTESLSKKWELNKEVLLPKISHGSKDNSVRIANIEADSIEARNIRLIKDDPDTNEVKKLDVPGLVVSKVQLDSGTETKVVSYQLRFFYGDEVDPDLDPETIKGTIVAPFILGSDTDGVLGEDKLGDGELINSES